MIKVCHYQKGTRVSQLRLKVHFESSVEGEVNFLLLDIIFESWHHNSKNVGILNSHIMLENNFTRLPFIEIIIISKLLYCEHRYLNYVLLNKNLPALWNNMLAWEQIPPHYLECGHVCACLFYCFGDFPNVNPLGSQLSSSVQMYCNWLCLRSCIQFLIFFLNRGRKIRCTSKGPIVHCEHCVLNCNKKKQKKNNNPAA